MASNTGFLVTVFQDQNPLSPTYLTTKEEKEKDETTCPLDTQIWEFTGSYCEVGDGGIYTGNRVDCYVDVNPASNTYMEQKNTVIKDLATCPPQSTEPEWQDEGGAWCDTKLYTPGNVEGNNGEKVQEQIDQNPYSSTYLEHREVKTTDTTVCPLPDTNAKWVEISRSCHTVAYGWGIGYDGTEDIVEIDENTYSPTYNSTRTRNVANQSKCPKSDSDPKWQTINTYCETSGGENTGYLIEVQEDMNRLSSTFRQQRTNRYYNTSVCPLPPPPPPPDP
jgi:hypothetical protein